MQECCVINWGKGCLYHGCLGLVAEVYDNSQKTSKDNQKNSARKFGSLLHCIYVQHLVVNDENVQLFKTVHMLHVGMVGYPLTRLW